MSERRLLIATSNRGKLREITAMLSKLPIEILSLQDFPDLPTPVEDAPTFDGNARLKALHYADRTGAPTLADDSGLEVDVLGGQPGVRSARFSGPDATDAQNNTKLLALLVGVPREQRTARFRCAMALAVEGEIVATAIGAVEGVIIDEAKGANGFGYDPHFFVGELGLTAAQMPPEQKNRISHRRRAIEAVVPALCDLFGVDRSW